MLFSYNVSTLNGKTLDSIKNATDANISVYGKTATGHSIFSSDNNKNDFMHKVTESDKQITVCAENKNGASETAQVYMSFKSSVHVNDFSNVATTVRLKKL